MLKPLRLVNLTEEEEEEEVRCHMTWQEFDRCLWLAGCADAADLVGEVLCPDEFAEKRKEVILGFSDQVPFWVKLAAGKQVYPESETRKHSEKKNKVAGL